MRAKKLLYIAFGVLTTILASCTDEAEIVTDDEAPITFSARSEWIDGRVGVTRAIDDALKGDVPSPKAPGWLYVTVTQADNTPADPEHFVVKPDDTKPDPDSPEGYTDYHGFYLLEGDTWVKQKKMVLSRGTAKNLKFKAYYFGVNSVDGTIPVNTDQINSLTTIPAISDRDLVLSSEATQYPSSDNGKEYRDHILFQLQHSTSLLRLKFAVSEKYLSIRDIVLRNVTINDNELLLDNAENLGGTPPSEPLPGKQLSSTPDFYAFAYVNPVEITASKSLSFKCTYDIYDKDEISKDHCTRKGVTATNVVALNKLSTPIAELKTGYFYDLTITIDPDYLYVLSEHDNKHLTIE